MVWWSLLQFSLRIDSLSLLSCLLLYNRNWFMKYVGILVTNWVIIKMSFINTRVNCKMLYTSSWILLFLCVILFNESATTSIQKRSFSQRLKDTSRGILQHFFLRRPLHPCEVMLVAYVTLLFYLGYNYIIEYHY